MERYYFTIEQLCKEVLQVSKKTFYKNWKSRLKPYELRWGSRTIRYSVRVLDFLNQVGVENE